MKKIILLFIFMMGLSALLFTGIFSKGAVLPSVGAVEVEFKQAVCNVSPDAQGTYTEDGCKTAFNDIPLSGIKGCSSNQKPQIKSCKVHTDPDPKKNACTNKELKTGNWCTCTYTCVQKTM